MEYKMQLLKKQIPAAGATVSISEETDKGHKYLTGISVLDTHGKQSTFENSNVNGDELLPKGFETGYIQSDSSVPADLRFFSVFNRPADGTRVEITFKDDGNASTYPYNLVVYLRLQNEPIETPGI